MRTYRKQRRTKNSRRSRKQVGGKQVLINIGGQSYQAADVLILNTWDNDGKIYIVLYQSNLNQKQGDYPMLSLPGGRCEDSHGGRLEVTARTELYEESRKSVFINERIFEIMARPTVKKYVDIHGQEKGGLYGMRRVFVVKLPGVSQRIYNANKKIMDADSSTSRCFNETNAMVRILPEELRKLVRHDDDGRGRVLTRKDGKKYWIDSTVMKAFIAAKHEGLIENPFFMERRMEEKAKSGQICWSQPTINGITTDTYN